MLVIPLVGLAGNFWKTGNITRTMSDAKYGGCMIQLDVDIGTGCPENGWVSLDCDGKYFGQEQGRRHFASALIAATLGKKVTLYIDNTKKHDNYCVARRLDVVF